VERVARVIEDAAKIRTDPFSDRPEIINVDDVARAALAAAEPTGWKLVPIEPTEKMEMEGKCELVTLRSDLATSKWAARKTYRAMVEAAPLPPPPEDKP